MIKVLIIAAAVLVGILVIAAALIYAIGSRLPVDHVASRSLRLNRPPAEVYSAVRNFEACPTWRPDVRTVEMLGEENGHLRFREIGPHGAITYELIEDQPDRRIVTRIADRDLGYAGSWTYEFAENNGETLLTITENGEVTNSIFRFMSRYIFGHTATIDAYLKALAQRFDEEPSP